MLAASRFQACLLGCRPTNTYYGAFAATGAAAAHPVSLQQRQQVSSTSARAVALLCGHGPRSVQPWQGYVAPVMSVVCFTSCMCWDAGRTRQPGVGLVLRGSHVKHPDSQPSTRTWQGQQGSLLGCSWQACRCTCCWHALHPGRRPSAGAGGRDAREQLSSSCP